MCGVLFALARHFSYLRSWLLGPFTADHSDYAEFRNLQARGPDCYGQAQALLPNGGGAAFVATLLQLRGAQPLAAVPLTGPDGSILLFNGEVYGGLAISDQDNDGAALFQALQCTSSVPDVLARLEGPWAAIYYCKKQQRIWFGRDALGRRSLLVTRLPEQGLFLLSSVWLGSAAAGEQLELEPGLYSIDLAASHQPAECWPATRQSWNTSQSHDRLSSYRRDAALIISADLSPRIATSAAQQVLDCLQRAVSVQCTSIQHPHQRTCGPQATDRVTQAAPVLILFSGGVDSTLIAALAHRALPAHVPIDLSCVCFDGGQSPDRLAALDALQELAAFAPTRCWRLVEVDATLADVQQHRQHLLELLRPADTVMDLNIGAALWLAARAQGRMRLISAASPPHPAEINCATPQPLSTPSDAAATSIPASSTPQTSPEAYARLQASPEAELRAGDGRSTAGSVSGGMPEGDWRSQARVVLLGQGADEQCAGYGRHRTRFRAGGWEGLQEEMGLDMRRLWLRNLGRDDRLVSDHGRESRHPFLDETLVQLLLGLPLPLIADLRLPSGVGDKIILRNILRMLGLPRAAARPKRAIQFGSRIGKLANVQDFGSNRAANARNAGSVKLSDLPAQE